MEMGKARFLVNPAIGRASRYWDFDNYRRYEKPPKVKHGEGLNLCEKFTKQLEKENKTFKVVMTKGYRAYTQRERDLLFLNSKAFPRYEDYIKGKFDVLVVTW
jgi:hypothetical protein